MFGILLKVVFSPEHLSPYRPIYFLHNIHNVLKLILKHLNPILDSNSIIPNHLFGFGPYPTILSSVGRFLFSIDGIAITEINSYSYTLTHYSFLPFPLT